MSLQSDGTVVSRRSHCARSVALRRSSSGRALTTLRSSLEGISDAETARAALPRLQALDAQVDRLGGAIGQLTAEQRKLFVGVDPTMMNSLNQLMDRVVAIPGVSGVLKPTIDSLKQKLATLPA